MHITLRLKRFDPESIEPASEFQDFDVDLDEASTVLDAIIKVHEEIDGTVAVRYSCRSSICGSCAMRINGSAGLGCKTRVREVADESVITVEPVGNMPVIKDLITDFQPFWEKIRAVDPYLRPTGPEPDAEYPATNETMVDLLRVVNCIMCGCCVSDCAVLEVDNQFLGPAALAKAYRFVGDTRDGTVGQRLKKLNDEAGGIWDCTRCLRCVEVCPKSVAPMDRIMEMREMAIADGNRNTAGYRHAESFTRSVKKNGRLDETRLAVESVGLTNVSALVGMVPVGVAALRKGKMPPIRPHRAENHEKITELIERIQPASD